MSGLDHSILLGVAILLAGVAAARFANRIGAPALLLFLSLGLLLGEDGPGGIRFDDAHLTEQLGVLALAVILFEGGLGADRRELRRVLGPVAALASVGVLVTATVTGVAAALLLDLPPARALLVGAVVASTDAAAVFASVRGVALLPRLRATLEGESGLNDPVAALLVVVLVQIATPPAPSTLHVLGLVVLQLGLGLVGGVAFAYLARALAGRVQHASPGLVPVAALSCALACFASVTALHGSGFLAVYVLGLLLSARPLPYASTVTSFHEAIAWLAQIALFVLLGLLVTPSRLLDEGLAPVGVALVLVLVARPLAVALSTTPFGFTLREQAFLSWAGLRGAVPIVFATFPIVEHVPGARRLFDIVFYVVLVSVIVQGFGLRRVAAALGVVGTSSPVRLADLDIATLRSLGAHLIEVRAGELGTPVGGQLRDARLPGQAIVAAIRRGERMVVPRGSTRLEEGDVLYLLVEHEKLADIERALSVSGAP